jgi:hypothetical protein
VAVRRSPKSKLLTRDFQTGVNVGMQLASVLFCFFIFFLTTRIPAQPESQNSSRYFFTTNDLKIHDLDNFFCIARDKSAQQCLLSVFQYDNWCDIFISHGFRRDDGLDSARRIAIDLCLDNIYYLLQGKKWGLDTVSLILNEANSSAQNSINDLEEKRYRGLYEKFYQDYFAASNELVIQLFGSSDSLVADTIAKQLAKEGIDRAKKTMKSGIPVSLLPYDILKNIDSLTPGRTKTVKTVCGYFVVRVLDSTIAYPEIPFNGARQMLHQLALQENVTSYDRKFLREYYDEHVDDFSMPDTLDLKVWLMPRKISDSNSVKNRLLFSEKSSKTIVDTARYKALVLTQWALPDSIRAALDKKDSLFLTTGNAEIGNTLFGTWYIKLLSVRKGRGYIPFSRIKWNTVSPKHLEGLDKKKTGDVRDSYFAYFLAASAHSHEQQLVQPPTVDDLIRVAQQDNIDTTGLNAVPEEKKEPNVAGKKISYGNRTLLEMRHSVLSLEKNIRKWKETVSIDTRVYNIR